MKITVDKPLFLLYDKENVFWKTFSWENFIKNTQILVVREKKVK